MSAADLIAEAERRLAEALRLALGSPTEQYERIEAMIDSFDRAAAGIDRGGCPWWKPTAPG